MSPEDPTHPKISFDSVYYHYRKWSKDGSLKAVWEHSILTIVPDLDLSPLNLNGTHTIAKKGGEAVPYQEREKAKTSNILPILDANGYMVTTSEIVAGNHNNAYEFKANLRDAF